MARYVRCVLVEYYGEGGIMGVQAAYYGEESKTGK